MREPVTAYIGVGANLGDPLASVLSAIDAIADMDQVALTASSSLYGSAPIDAGGADYVNAVVEVKTAMKARALLDQLHAMELMAGRERPYPNAPRTLDLDLLMYGDVQQDDGALTLPHPRMWLRAFVLVPLAEIAPHRVSPAQLSAVQSQKIWKLLPLSRRHGIP